MKAEFIPTHELKLWDVMRWGTPVDQLYVQVEGVQAVDDGQVVLGLRRIDLDEPDRLLNGFTIVVDGDDMQRVVSRGRPTPLRLVR